MNEISDETLMAFCDGELDANAAVTVRAALTESAELRERLQHMRDLDDLLRASIPADLEIPDRFKAALAETRSADVIPFRNNMRSWRAWVPAGTGIAAALLILIGGSALSPAPMAWLEQVEDGLALTGPVQAAMVSTPSGQRFEKDGLNIMPVVSFTSQDGRLCREVQLDDDEMGARILACRDRDENEWCIEAFARMPSLPHKNGYYTAGVPKDPVIDAAYARLGIRATLTTSAEKAAIARKWSQE